MNSSDSLSRHIPGSFRDPNGYVFFREQQLFRAIDDDFEALFSSQTATRVWESLMSKKAIVDTHLVKDLDLIANLQNEHQQYRCFLQHTIIEPITYPYEWSISMLADAGIHTLDLQIELIKAGYALKDATAYNIQYQNGRPIFIDISSIERPKRLDLWYALGQFNRMFTFPLILSCYRGWDLCSYFLANLDGMEVDKVIRAFGILARWRPFLLLDVTLPWWFGRKADQNAGKKKNLRASPSGNSQAQLMNLRRLRSKIDKLAQGYRPQGVWFDYRHTCSYDSTAEEAKKSLVRKFLGAAQPKTVLDVGCNTGDYSYVAASCGAKVIAVDSDHDAIECLYKKIRAKPVAITPMVVDITNPSPGLGYRNLEREKFIDRVQPDCVMALALLHHLSVSGNLSLILIRELFAELTQKHLLLEFVPVNDPMFQKLTAFRQDTFEQLTLANCKQVFQAQFVLLDEETIPNSSRSLLLWRKIC